jgi:response regulator of citrate/malate metabolism
MYDISEEQFKTILKIVEKRNKSLFNELSQLKKIEETPKNGSLDEAREVKTKMKIDELKRAINELNEKNETVTAGKLNKATGVSMLTIAKYKKNKLISF